MNLRFDIQRLIDLLEEKLTTLETKIKRLEAELGHKGNGRQGAAANYTQTSNEQVEEINQLVDQTFNVQKSQQAIRSAITKEDGGH